MENKPNRSWRQVQSKIHGLALGMTLGLGTVLLGQGCPASGQ